MKGYKSILKTSLLLFFFIMNIQAYSTNLQVQTIRGQVIDQDSKMPLIGANVILLNTDPLVGTSTDANGNFRFEQIHVGRTSIKVSCIGYEEKTVPNILIVSGKEVVLEIELKESLIQLQDVVITANGHKSEPLNEMALVSAKAFSVDETQRYAGSFSDPARMVSGYAGVTGDAMGNNDIVVRGNSSKGILWKLDGMDIPNPNHFSDEGATGGPINALNSAMLNNSDFFSGAFAPEYGNAYSGVFDMKLRNGNNEKREYSASIGILGTDVTLEGPFSKNYSGSYLINYRYSSLDILDKLNVVNYYGIPKYQDAAIKINLPTKNSGTFQLIGFGGLSNIYQEDFALENEDSLTRTADFGAHVAFLAFKHIYPINDRTFITSYISGSSTENSAYYKKDDDMGNWYTAFYDEFTNTSIRVSTNINTKINTRHRLKLGVTYSDLGYNMFSKFDLLNSGTYTVGVDTEGRAGLIQGYANWKYRIHDNVTLVSGIHYIHFLLNNSNSLEPRLGLEWQINQKQSLSLGFGVHSKVESIATYFATVENSDGTYSTPNKDLGLSKSAQYVLGYSNRISKNVNVRIEAYYQQLYNLAVENDINSSFVLNNVRSGYENLELINKGKGYNYGLELTVERFLANNYYFLITSSLYNSKLTAMDGIERNSRFNGNYVSNILIGKEFRVGKPSKNKTLGINTKVSYIGGQRYTPLDLQASIDKGISVFQEDKAFAYRADDIFALNLGITYRRNRKKTTHEFKIDIQNLTNNKALVFEYYDDMNKGIEKAYQLAMLPNISYTIQF
ncbi:MAG: TonB-dependent receptor [Bacteroidetes bacterium GWF2_33_16]|nr:MAG: TonB-dependent receptor [Bacteroidetes bacterium GWE2_32_14]OFY03385.1 MAG: TonB-dependent receptor [Bacteroidetes bacterium GWF2_33_16]